MTSTRWRCLITKAMIEIPPRFAGKLPVNPEARQGKGSTDAVWKGAAGLAEDVRHYGRWMRDEAEKRIGHLYPKVRVTAEMARGAARPGALCGPGTDRDRLALGAHRQEPQPRLRRCRCAFGFHLRSLQEEGQRGLRRSGDRGGRLPLQGQGRSAIGERSGGNQACAWRELPVPNVWDANTGRLYQSRGQGRAHGSAPHGDRCRGRQETSLPSANARA